MQTLVKHLSSGRAMVATAMLMALAGSAFLAKDKLSSVFFSESSTTALGAIKADFDVHNNGSAVYSVPIIIPRGIDGFMPELKIMYNSHKSSGLLGLGWQIDGIPAITRCANTISQDGFKRSVQLDEQDKFCDGGERLISVQGTYGADGTEYRRERNNWARYYSHGKCGTGPCSFTVEQPNGQTKSYGDTDDSRIVASNKDDVRLWSINKAADRNGNYITFAYTNDRKNGEYYPAEIQYTANDAVQASPHNSIKFTYEDRPDKERYYIAGSTVERNSRLSSITTFVDNQKVRAYNIRYDISQNSGRSIVTQITECGKTMCYKPTQFSWGMGAKAQSALSLNNWYNQKVDDTTPQALVGDYDGDGLTDVATLSNNAGRVQLNTYISDGKSFDRQNWFNSATPYEEPSLTSSGDFNGDSIQDVVHLVNDGGKIGINLYTSNRTAFTEVKITTDDDFADEAVINSGDFNGNGLSDLVYTYNNEGKIGFNVYISDGATFKKDADFVPDIEDDYREEGKVYVADINNDGLRDILYTFNNAGILSILVYRSNGTEFLRSEIDTKATYTDDSELDIGDFKGDGKSDIIYFFDNAGNVGVIVGSINNDNTFDSASWLSDNIPWRAGSIKTGDFNGDNLVDIAYIREGDDQTLSIDTYLSNGTSFVFNDTTTQQDGWSDGAEYIPTDFNGDGKTDILNAHPLPDAFVMDMYLSSDQPGNGGADTHYADIITSITDGENLTTKVTYQPMTNLGVYSKNALSDAYPTNIVTVPSYIVSNVSIMDAASEVIRSYQYQYRDAKVNLIGRGWLGFATMIRDDLSAKDSTLHTREITEFHQDFPLQGLEQGKTIVDLSRNQDIKKHALGLRSVQNQDRTFTVLKTDTMVTGFSSGRPTYTSQEVYQYSPDNQNIIQVAYLRSDAKNYYACRKYLEATPNQWWRAFFLEHHKILSQQVPCGDLDYQTWVAGRDLQYTKYAYDDKLNVVSSSRWDDQLDQMATSTHTYDAFGNVVSAVDPLNTTVNTVFDSYGYATQVTHTSPDRQISVTKGFEYDPGLGVQVKEIDANGNESKAVVIDDFGRILQTSKPQDDQKDLALLSVSEFTQDAEGRTQVITRTRHDWTLDNPQDWYYTANSYDAIGKVVERRYRSGDDTTSDIVKNTSYNNAGLVSSVTVPYFANNQVLHAKNTLYDVSRNIRQVAIDSNILLKVLRDPSNVNKISKLTPDPQSNTPGTYVTQVATRNSAGHVLMRVEPNGTMTHFEYDPIGRLISKTDEAGVITTYRYSSRNRITQESVSNLGTIQYTYDLAGRPSTTTDALGQKEEYAYDAIGRKIGIKRHDAEGKLVDTVTYEYDKAPNGVGKISTMTTNGRKVEYEYNFNRLPSKKTITLLDLQQDNQFVFQYKYNPLKILSSAILPDNTTIDYSFDKGAKLDKVTYNGNTVASYNKYLPYGKVSEIVHGNNVKSTFEYDPIGRITKRTINSGTTTIADYAYTWNDANKVLSTAETSQNAAIMYASTDYMYNDMGYLLKAQHSTRSGEMDMETFEYSPAGDITQYNDMRYMYDQLRPHQLVRVCTAVRCQDSMTLQYDALGRTISRQASDNTTTTYGYKGAGMRSNLSNVLVDEKETLSFEYNDSLTQRTAKVDHANKTKTYYLTPSYIMTTDLDGNNRTTEKYISDINGMVAMVKGDEVQYAHHNHVKNIDILTDKAGSVLQVLNYSSYGSLLSRPTEDVRFKFASKEMDDSGLYAFGMRYYDPAIKRFVTMDPRSQYSSPYLYSGNDPISKYDINGGIAIIDDIIEAVVSAVATISAEATATAASEGAAVAGSLAVVSSIADGTSLLSTTAELTAVSVAADAAITAIGGKTAEAGSEAATVAISSADFVAEIEPTASQTLTSEIDGSTASDGLTASNSHGASSSESPDTLEDSANELRPRRTRAQMKKSISARTDHQFRVHYRLGQSVRVYTGSARGSAASFTQNTMADIGPQERTLILSGHGTWDGKTAAEIPSVGEPGMSGVDAVYTALKTPIENVTVADLALMTSAQVNEALTEGTLEGTQYSCVVASFCFSEIRFQIATGGSPESITGRSTADAPQSSDFNFWEYL